MTDTIVPSHSPEAIRDSVRARYGAIAESRDGTAAANQACGCGPTCCTAGATATRADTGCCGDECCSAEESATDAGKLGYSAEDSAAVPTGADLGLGCGNPLALAPLHGGETVLDLGSGAGFDALLAAKRVGPRGHVIGVDMTPAMLAKARRNAATAGAAHVEFRLGEIEHLPVADRSVDLVISNCVINLSPEKAKVFREAFRVLKPGGRLAVTDIVATRPLPPRIRDRLALIGACIGGASEMTELHSQLAEAGFAGVEIRPRESSRALIADWGNDPALADLVVSAEILAVKP